MKWIGCTMSAITMSYNAFDHQEPVWEKDLEGKHFVCRRIFLPADVSVVIEWKHSMWGPVTDFGHLSQAMLRHWSDLATGTEGQVFILLCEGRPLMILEVVDQLFSELSVSSMLVSRGEYEMIMHYNPDVTLVPLQKKALRSICDWWKKEGIPRVWTNILTADLLGSVILMNAGFELVDQMLPEEATELYVFPRLPA